MPTDTHYVLVTGVHGLVGTALKPFLERQGHRVLGLKLRYQNTLSEVHAFLERYGPFTAVVHLCGEPVMQNWGPRALERVRESRIGTTQVLVRALSRQGPFVPKVFIQASGIGIYGTHPRGCAAPLTEGDPPNGIPGFLSTLAKDWETAAAPLLMSGVRVANLRLAPILSPNGGMLRSLLLLLKIGIYPKIGTGQQAFPWISLNDLLALIARTLVDSRFNGPINAVAPQQLSYKGFTDALRNYFPRRLPIWVPRFVFDWIYGQGFTDEMIFSNTSAFPKKALDNGFVFTHPTINQALEDFFG